MSPRVAADLTGLPVETVLRLACEKRVRTEKIKQRTYVVLEDVERAAAGGSA